ncbi:MerR family transcriptional regulator [Leptolyngbya sp. NIES-2104]|uniref:MerR family transcriptional regulator n=1 Tax=Leptolyngbya sp. NIES-2104 TaxID=1552121 RepID=UPI0006EC8E7C|nr:TipAS antibiotic-recognition domain-containing protein [Leptolyngbya sp. NIES-2104]GAP96919.1 transcriptional regulator, MerR family [Leptolyngbya sp. NIES-2104]
MYRVADRTGAGYRVYGQADIIRLQQIVSLRQIGFSLDQIRDCLEQEQFSPQHVVQLHLSQLKEQIALQQRLYTQLEAISAHLQAAEPISIQAFIQIIKVTTMIGKYYTSEQQDYLKTRAEQIGQERIRQVEAEWQDLNEQARTAMANGIDPSDESVQVLARRCRSLIEELTGGDPEIARSLNTMYQQERAETASRGAVDTALAAYMSRAMQRIKQS